MNRSTRRLFWYIGVALLLVVILTGCSGSSGPTSPAPNDKLTAEQSADVSQTRMLWGFYAVEIDPETLEANIIPLRTAEFNANVTRFMQPPASPIHMMSVQIDPVASDIVHDLVVMDITFRHPFPGLKIFRGFDVRGIFMGNSSRTAGFDNTAKYANWSAASPGVPTTEPVLLNPDGYTRFWNPTEFTNYGIIFGYTHGHFAPADFYASATINPYKYFCDGLGAKDELNINPATRGTFSLDPGTNARRYSIQFNAKPWRYCYAIDASWALPDEAGAPHYNIDSYPTQANCQEAYQIKLSDTGSSAYYYDAGNKGGTFTLTLDIFDWQAAGSLTNPSLLLAQISRVWIESPAFETKYFNILAGTYELLHGTVDTSAKLRVEVTPDFSANGITAAGEYPVLICVESASPSTYQPQIGDAGLNFKFPPAPLAAYATGLITVQSGTQIPVLVLEPPVTFAPNQGPQYNMYTPAIIVENDNDVVFAYEEWFYDIPNNTNTSISSARRSVNDGTSFPEWKSSFGSWGWHHHGDACKIFASSTNTSWRTLNLINPDETSWATGFFANTFFGPYGDEYAHVSHSISHANEILQDAAGYVYAIGDHGGAIQFRRSQTPNCLNCGPSGSVWGNNIPVQQLTSPGTLSRVRSSALYNGMMYLAYFINNQNTIKLARATTQNDWNTSTVIWNGAGSGTSGARDPGLHIDDKGFQVTFVRRNDTSGNDQVCYTYSSNGTTWTAPVVIYEGKPPLRDTPICRYDWNGLSTLGVIWWEVDLIYAAFSLNDGASWSAPVIVSMPPDQFSKNKQPDMDIAPTMNWHFVYSSLNPATGMWHIQYRRAHMEWQ